MRKILHAGLVMLMVSIVFEGMSEARRNLSTSQKQVGSPVQALSKKKFLTYKETLLESNQPGLLPVIPVWDPERYIAHPATTPAPTRPSLTCLEALHSSLEITEKLDYCPNISRLMLWQAGDGAIYSYPSWTPEQKNRLQSIFDALVRGDRNLGINCPNPARNIAETPVRQLYLTAEEAFDVYVAHVAHVLYLEVQHLVPWSILDFPEIQLRQLLSSQNYHDRLVGVTQVYFPSHIRPNRDFQVSFSISALPTYICDPRIGYRFLKGETSAMRMDMVGSTQEDAMINITDWARSTFIHETVEIIRRENIISYAFLDRRLESRGGVRGIPVYGCHGAANLIQDLARSINIALLNVGTQDFNSTSGNFGNRNHRGLVFNAGTSAVKILQSTDDIHATETQDIYPVNSMGRRVFEDEAKRLYFQTQWVSPSLLRSWGFQLFSDFPDVYPGVGFGESRNLDGTLVDLREENYSNYGKMLGYWNYSTTGDRQAPNAFLREKNYQLCGWQLISDYCSMGPTVFFNTYQRYLISRDGFSPPIVRSQYDFWNQSARCIPAYARDCEDINRVHDSWVGDFGINTLR